MEAKSCGPCMSSVITSLKNNISNEKEWVLVYGNPKRQSFLMNHLSNSYISPTDEFFYIYLKSSEIETPLDFFLPILKEKFGEQYYEEHIRSVVDMYLDSDEKDSVFMLAEMCGKEKVSGADNSDKMPVILIDGIEEVLFRLDYPETDIGKSDIGTGRQKLPDDLGFGRHLRKYLHQVADKAVVYGTVKDSESIQYLLTLGNDKYRLDANNFLHVCL